MSCCICCWSCTSLAVKSDSARRFHRPHLSRSHDNHLSDSCSLKLSGSAAVAAVAAAGASAPSSARSSPASSRPSTAEWDWQRKSWQLTFCSASSASPCYCCYCFHSMTIYAIDGAFHCHRLKYGFRSCQRVPTELLPLPFPSARRWLSFGSSGRSWRSSPMEKSST